MFQYQQQTRSTTNFSKSKGKTARIFGKDITNTFQNSQNLIENNYKTEFGQVKSLMFAD